MRGFPELVVARFHERDVRIVAIAMTDKKGAVGVYDNGQAYLEVESTDPIPRLDLRALAGLRVVVVPHDDPRGLELVDRLAEFGPLHIGYAGNGYCAQWTREGGLVEW